MKSIIIAAGHGGRLGKFAQTKPKGLLDINGMTILERQISLFRKYGINDNIIITGPIEDFGIKDVTYINDKDFAEHDVLGSLMAARNEIKGDVITSYSDILFEESILKQLVEFKGNIGIPLDLDWKKSYEGRSQHPKSEADNVLLRKNQILKIQKEILEKQEDEIIAEFLGPIRFSANGAKIFVDVFEKLEKTHQGSFHKSPSLKKAYLTDLLQELIDLKIDVTPIFINGKWCEVDTPQDLERARKLFF